MGYTVNEVNNFIERMAPVIKSEAQKRGYKICSTVIAQAIIEGACGKSSLAKNYHNHFGLKCGSAWKGKSVNLKTKEEYKVGTLTTIKDNFRAYDSDPEGIAGYYDFISTKRYANLKNATTYRQYAEYLKADGYATSSTYVNTLCTTVDKYNLQRFDTDTIQNVPITTRKTNEEIAAEVLAGKWGNGIQRRKNLEEAGYIYSEVQNIVNLILKG